MRHLLMSSFNKKNFTTGLFRLLSCSGTPSSCTRYPMSTLPHTPASVGFLSFFGFFFNRQLRKGMKLKM